MNLNNIALPHPVLGHQSSINGIVAIGPEEGGPVIETKEDSYEITLQLKHDNPEILRLIDEGKAEYYCEITCSETLLRKVVLSKDDLISVSLSKAEVKRKVEFLCLCITTEIIENYKNPLSHQDYMDFYFTLDRGDILAYFGKFSFDVEIQYQKLKAAASFMEIVPQDDKNEEYVDYVFSGPKILVKLPVKDYELFSRDIISTRKEFSPIIHSSIVQNALTVALFNFKTYLEQETLWAKTIEYRLLNEQDLNDGSTIIDSENILIIVQKLLGNPTRRMLEGLVDIINISNPD